MTRNSKPKRILIIGTAGSGKSTLARNFSQFYNIKEIELDEINWRPQWENRQITDIDGFKSDVKDAICDDDWVATGGYASVRDKLWMRANIIIWLDLPFLTVLSRVLIRSIKRSFGKKETFKGCKENWWDLLKWDRPIRWAIHSFQERRESFETMAKDERFSHAIIYRCKTPQMVNECFNYLTFDN